MMSLNFTIDGFRISYGLIAVWMWVLSGLFSPEYFFHERDHLKRYAAFTILTFIATEGVMFSADLMTTFLFFEILSMCGQNLFHIIVKSQVNQIVRKQFTHQKLC